MERLTAFLVQLSKNQYFAWILLGSISFLGLLWQFKLLKADFRKIRIRKLPSRLKASLYICIFLAIGVIIEGIIAIHYDKYRAFTYGQMWQNFFNLFPFSILFLFKTVIGPTLVVGSVSLTVYYFIQYGQLIYPPIIKAVMEFVSSLLPNKLGDFYNVLFAAYAVITSWHDTSA